jgi:high-affinity iron transporter
VIASFLITLREGIEAALVVAIMLSYLVKTGAKIYAKPMYLGVILGIVASIAVAGLFELVAVEFEGSLEAVFEGSTLFLAAAILTTMIAWMARNSRAFSDDLKAKMDQVMRGSRYFGLAFLAFISVFREGVETVLFLGSASFTSTGVQLLVGGLLGLAVAALIGFAIIRYSVRLNLRTFFNVTGILLILFAAGLVSRGLFEFEEAGLVPSLVEHVWNSNWIVNDQSTLGSLLTSLLGYNGAPSLTEILGYVVYWVLVLYLVYRVEAMSLIRRLAHFLKLA